MLRAIFIVVLLGGLSACGSDSEGFYVYKMWVYPTGIENLPDQPCMKYAARYFADAVGMSRKAYKGHILFWYDQPIDCYKATKGKNKLCNGLYNGPQKIIEVVFINQQIRSSALFHEFGHLWQEKRGIYDLDHTDSETWNAVAVAERGWAQETLNREDGCK